jgi:ribosome-associated toxin RatA of RatAB toxin-antitoxin module
MTTWEIHDNQFDLSITHSIAAPKEIVYEVLADMEAYPAFINDLVSVKRDGELYHFLARAAILTIPVTVAVTKTPSQSVAFEMVEGPVDQLSGAWLIEAGEVPEETKVALTLHAETGERGEWLLRMTGQYVQNKTNKLVNAFSDRVAEVQRGEVRPIPAEDTAPATRIIGWLSRLWARLFGGQAPAASERPVAPAKPVSTLFREKDRIQTLEALASTMIPADDFDPGAGGLGFISLAEMRARYEAGREELYATALHAVDVTAQAMFDKPRFVDLTSQERSTLLDAVRGDQVNADVWGQIKPSSFFGALWEDVVFLYCTHPDTWRRIGFPGPSFETGGHPDLAQPQVFMGEPSGEG